MAVTADDVRAIYPPADDLTDAQVEAVITTAGVILAQTSCFDSLDEAVQDEVQKHLAAHLLAVQTLSGGAGVATSMKLGDASESYASGHLGEGLRATSYGVTAITLAPCLQTIGQKRAHIEVV
jgi:hypothetical protein